MNAYQNRTFIIGSNTHIGIRYFNDDNTPMDLSRYTNGYIIFTNLSSEVSKRIDDISNLSKAKDGYVDINIAGNSYPESNDEFFYEVVNDSYGYGTATHSYSIWLNDGFSDECILRGKAFFVKGK